MNSHDITRFEMAQSTSLQSPRAETPPPTVLFVDDLECMRTGAEAILTRAGFNVLLASDGKEGVDIFEAQADNIAVIVSDVVMPILCGPEMYRKIRDRHGHVPTLFLTGYSIESLERDNLVEPGVPIMKKPFSVVELIETVKTLAAERTPVEANG